MRSHSARLPLSCALVALTCAGFGSTVRAQNFNLDYGEDPVLTIFPLPSNGYGGAASQPGVWIGMADGVAGQLTPPVSSPWYVASNLVDVNNNATGVSTSAMVSSNTNSVGDFVFNNASTTGDDEALMDDVADMGNATISPQPFMVVTFTGLAPGSYEVYTYAWAPDSSTFITRVAVDNSTGTNPQTSGGAWPGGHVLGTTYTLHTVSVCLGTITITTTSISGFGSINGIQLKQAGPATCTTSFCFGTQATCPCALAGQNPNSGCQNETGTGGAVLTITGNASISADLASPTVFLNMTNAPPLKTTIFFQGTTSIAAVLFGDGLRCVGGALVRLNAQNPPPPPGDQCDGSGALTYPTAGHPASINQRLNPPFPPAPLSPGDIRYYFAQYRDPTPNACAVSLGGTVNTTNAVELVWGP